MAVKPSLAATLRARQVLEAASLPPDTPLERVPYTTNEVWFAGEHVLRISPDARDGRLQLEARLSTLLPASIPHAQVVASGTAAVGAWLVMERMPGQPLSAAWPSLAQAERRDAIAQLAAALRRFHSVQPSLDVLALAAEDPPHPLPASRTHGYLMRARQLPGVEPDVADRLERLIDRIGDSLDPAEMTSSGLVHGDLHFDNVLWDDGRLTAVLDLEWVRPGPPDLDLDVLIEYCAAPELSAQTEDRFALTPADLAPVLRWLELDYPELFAHPRVDDRLYLYRVAYDLRALLRDPPDRFTPKQEHHPYNRLRRIVG